MERKISEEDEKKIKIMKATPFFEPFTDDELLIILNNSHWLKCSPGDVVVKEGESANAFYIILKGSIDIMKRTGIASLKKTLLTLKRGHCFGEMSVISGKPRSADIIAREETYVLKVDADTLHKETDSFEFRSIQFKFYKLFCEILTERLNAIDEKYARPF